MPLTRERIVAEALALLDETGLEGVSLRKLATRLGIQAPTLYWYVRNKRELTGEMAEAILRPDLETLPEPKGTPWREWLLDAASRFRRALLSHRDGARIVAEAQRSTTMADLTEHALSVLVEQGESVRQARLLVLLVERFTLGLVLEEQSGQAEPHDVDREALAERYPLTTAGITEYFGTGATVDDLFRHSVRLMLGATAP
ncbi:TetR family transcriptional regulator [Amycolatopsis acidicola]|uniref:TetR family transcriptional regulator n=1 Tax=Amycolatopsis acidicola TaxID=2596893 RepID=A0A5N0V022_9PSEU|nr:TetR/AcrR family transcriptional regulator C-terminal domain-containing protein [Amycolatopsis acidicola]KAA9157587.1 TetR family transcriptional regulator [Amycolatopsis acidicola]